MRILFLNFSIHDTPRKPRQKFATITVTLFSHFFLRLGSEFISPQATIVGQDGGA